MKVTIVYDNKVCEKGLGLIWAEWGFSCVVEVENTPRILFDTGTDGRILLHNMEKIGIDPMSIDELFISHIHRDHTGGMTEFLEVNKKVKVYVPYDFPPSSTQIEVSTIKKPTKIHENVFSTGGLNWTKTIPNVAPLEQSMCVNTDKGIVVIVGCSHPRVSHILEAASGFGELYAVIGGLHGFKEYSLFRDLGLICPTHCTQHIEEIKRLYPDKYVSGGVGQQIQI